MGNGYTARPSDDYAVIVEQLRDLGRRLSELEQPTGTSMNSLVDQVQEAIANINATVTAAITANSYTKTQIDNKVANPPAGSNVTGDIAASGNLSITGAATIGGNLLVNGSLRDPDAATYNITGTRLTLWVETATGRLGNTASSRYYKQDEILADVDPEAVLGVSAKMFHYIAEVRKRDDPTFEDYVGPDYVVADEYGFMAEDLHDAGLHPWVIYGERDGNIVPESVDYVMWVVALQIAAHQLAADRDQLRADVDELRAAVAALQFGASR